MSANNPLRYIYNWHTGMRFIQAYAFHTNPPSKPRVGYIKKHFLCSILQCRSIKRHAHNLYIFSPQYFLYFSLLLCNSNTCKRGNSSQPFTKIMKWPKYEHNTQRYYYSTSKYTYIITFIWLAPVIILIVMTLAGLYIITRALSWSTRLQLQHVLSWSNRTQLQKYKITTHYTNINL